MRDGQVDLLNVGKGSHVCWVVSTTQDYYSAASAMMSKGLEYGEKLFVFGPAGSPDRARLEALGAISADPLYDFLEAGPLEPKKMFQTFKDLATSARAEGYSGFRVIADMDWLLSAEPSPAQIVSFELLLDKIVLELGATVVCVYRSSSFDRGCLEGVASVHPLVSGMAPTFRFVSAGDETWRLSGEIDICALAPFTEALSTVTQEGRATVDLDGLRFIDCSGMRTMASTLAAAPRGVRVKNVPAFLQRFWSLASLDEILPLESVTG